MRGTGGGRIGEGDRRVGQVRGTGGGETGEWDR